jgi:hypothetical protein
MNVCRRRNSTVWWLLVIVPIAVMKAPACPQLGKNGTERAIDQRDNSVLEIVLLDLVSFKEFKKFTEGHADGKDIVLQNHTSENAWVLEDKAFKWIDKDKGQSISADIAMSLRIRNVKTGLLYAFKPKSAHVLVESSSKPISGSFLYQVPLPGITHMPSGTLLLFFQAIRRTARRL